MRFVFGHFCHILIQIRSGPSFPMKSKKVAGNYGVLHWISNFITSRSQDNDFMCGGRLWMWDNCIDSLCGDQTAIPMFSHILNNCDWKWVSIDFSNVSSWKVHLHTCCLIEAKRNLVEWKWQLSSLTEGAMFGAKHVKPYFGHCSGTTCQILRPFDTHHTIHI